MMFRDPILASLVKACKKNRSPTKISSEFTRVEKEGSIHRRVKNAQMNLDWCDTYCYEVDHLACLASHKVGVSYKPILPGTTVHIIRTQLCSCELLKCWEVITKMHKRAEQIPQVALYVVLWSIVCCLCYDTAHFYTLDFTQLCIPVYCFWEDPELCIACERTHGCVLFVRGLTTVSCLWEDSLNFTQSIQKETPPTGRATWWRRACLSNNYLRRMEWWS